MRLLELNTVKKEIQTMMGRIILLQADENHDEKWDTIFNHLTSALRHLEKINN
jgi:hypothetical protein